MRRLSFYFILVMSTSSLVRAHQSCEDKVARLEARVEKLEQILENLEDRWVERYGLIRRCEHPVVDNGSAVCETSKKMKPGTKCSVICNPGYIASPGHRSTECVNLGRSWSNPLKCEVPLVVIAGGQVADDMVDNSIEVLDLENDKTCSHNIADMPTSGGKSRNLHSLIYNPSNKEELLVCNGVSDEPLATCDSWSMKNATGAWKRHSYPNKGDEDEQVLGFLEQMVYKNNVQLGMTGLSKPSRRRAPINPDRKKGRYASEALTINDKPVIIGGMIYKGNDHGTTKTVRRYLYSGDWSRANGDCQDMILERAFFCSIKVHEAGIINIGGFSDSKILSNVTVRGCGPNFPTNARIKFPNLPTPLSGHSCSMLPDEDDVNIIVAGGSRNQLDDARSSSYLYRTATKKWEQIGNINLPRFGSRMVTVGSSTYILGGKERNPELYLDSIELFDKQSKTWKVVQRRLNKPRAHFGIALVPRSALPQC